MIVVLIITTAGCITPDENPAEETGRDIGDRNMQVLIGVGSRVLDCKMMTATKFQTRTTLIFRGELTEAITQLIGPGSMKITMESMAE